ncbi:diguanylate cyclase (GGDEF) domain protein [Paenibacillus sp. oral taxon 786 str. D14]|uniref:putative bifunctional diguanylate cyclase/phosphodiesterase n=1 Tax=Paenibacillus sp. oral taxon 786 TaxID=652715 RepID=UPI0001AFDAF5|nr:EAL domain-containing protein [Paenibacillus sp. oral taxon 786]EES71397.1 diguanylate cyclase (GGDEF) domain protein [Paenibacillus sp. oral taxon 786 str. D14]
MRIRAEERTTIIQGVIGLAAMIGVVQLSAWNGYPPGTDAVVQTLHLLAGLMCLAVSFAIFAQGWILFTDKLSKQRLYTAVLFSMIGILDILYTVLYGDISLLGFEPSGNLATWFLVISHLLGAFGMLRIFAATDQQVSGQQKVTMFVSAVLVTLAGLFVLNRYQDRLPTLFETELLQLVLQAGIPLLYLLVAAAVLYRHRAERPPAMMTVTRSLLFMAMGHVLLTCPPGHVEGLTQAAGQWYMGISYYIVLKGVYRLTIEEPLRGKLLVEAQMKHMAYHDDLTGLPNLRQMKEQLDELLGFTRACIGVAVINIDRFKAINDSLGYSAGDKVLTELGSRLAVLEGPQQWVYRMGEDEFAVVFSELPDAAAAEDRAKQLLASVDPGVLIDDTEYHISLSMGLSVFPNDADSVNELIQFADMAVHHAKEQGVEFLRYHAAMKQRTQAKVELENDMRKALEREEFFLEFQPQIRLDTGKMVGMEALVRWNHPKRGLIPPSEFIPLAEESGLIVPLGEWVLKTACQYNKKWQMDGFEPVCVSVNLSMRQFRQYNLAEHVNAILREVGLDPQYLELEVTESMTYDIETALDQLHRLKRLGIHISIDDFGTGYSSLYYLKSLPIDRLKIDRAFVKEVMYDGNDAAIVSTITTMAHHLKLKVTAEGVENEEQLEFLKRQRCHEGQGYLFSKPVSAGVLESEFLSRLAG